jgi:aminobutyraldehyde dehydrogenase
VSTIKTGLQTTAGVEMGPLISAEQRDRVANFVARARRQKHIEVTTGGKEYKVLDEYYKFKSHP